MSDSPITVAARALGKLGGRPRKHITCPKCGKDLTAREYRKACPHDKK